MGAVISFPAVLRTGRTAKSVIGKAESATVIILPVIRIERHPDEPETRFHSAVRNGPRRRRRSRATR
jgi:hypothetical protein